MATIILLAANRVKLQWADILGSLLFSLTYIGFQIRIQVYIRKHGEPDGHLGAGIHNLPLNGFVCGLVAFTSSQMMRYWWIKVFYVLVIFEALIFFNEYMDVLCYIMVRAFEVLWIYYFYMEERSAKIQFIEKYIANQKLKEWKVLLDEILPN